MSTDDIIDYSLFGHAKIQKAVEALRSRPKLTREQVLQLEHERDMLMARFEEVTTIMQPLEESYVSVRRKMDAKYDPDKDRKLQEVNKAGSERHDQLWAQIEPLHEIWKRVVAARDARRYLGAMFGECRKISEIARQAFEDEEGKIS